MQLRPYQLHAVTALFHFWQKNTEGHPIICAPTGSGKSRILAEICRVVLGKRPSYRIVVASHRKELIEQNAKHLYDLLGQPIGIYSAGLGQKTMRAVTVANIQSIYKKQLDSLQLLIIDECHLLSPEDDSMYQRFIKSLRVVNPQLKIVGLSATPYRVDQGSLICQGSVFTHICYDIPLKQLIAEGFLSPVISKGTAEPVDFSDVRRSGHDFNQGELENKMLPLTAAHCAEIAKIQNRKKVLIFCTGIAHAQAVESELQKLGMRGASVYSGMIPMEREQILRRFRHGDLQFVCNCNILTTGYDHPELDAIAILRATKSASLYVQMVGRGMRIAPDKKDLLVLDFGGNILRHGCIDQIFVKQKGEAVEIGHAPEKECPECHTFVHIAVRVCPDCGYEFPIESCMTRKPETAPVVSRAELMPVDSTEFKIHRKGGDPDAPPMLRINYRAGLRIVSDFLCFEHGGYAAQKAVQKWHRLGGQMPPPTMAADAFNRQAELPRAAEMEVMKEGKYYRILRVTKHREATLQEPMDETDRLMEKYNF